uniref:Putative LOV domain-containing protein n=1 Tax=Dunaliella salina TaxID=3046 RepID=A0A126X1X1_DUNSA|nr:putative LOV domain-containing protein [Dunaliella salina]
MFPADPKCSMFLADPVTWRISYFSESFQAQMGHTKEELAQHDFFKLIEGSPDTPSCWRDISEIRDATREERPCSVCLLLHKKDCTPFLAQFALTPLRDDQGRLVHFMGILVDVTHLIGSTDPAALQDADTEQRLEGVAEGVELDTRKLAAELKLEPHLDPEHLEAHPSVPCSLKHALSTIISAFVLSDPNLPDCPIVFVSEPFLKLTGYPREQVIGRNCRFLQGPGTSPEEVQKIRDAMAKQTPVTVTLLNYTAAGVPFWNLLHVAPIRDADGKVAYYVGVQLGTRVAAKPSAATAEESAAQPQGGAPGQSTPSSTPSSAQQQQHAAQGTAATAADRQHTQHTDDGVCNGGTAEPSTSAPAHPAISAFSASGTHARAHSTGDLLLPPPQIKFSDKLYYSGVTGAVRVACRSLGSHGLRRCSVDQSSFGLKKSLSHDLQGGVGGRRSEGGWRPGQPGPDRGTRLRYSVDWAGQQGSHPLLKE